MNSYSCISIEELAHLCVDSGDLDAWEEFIGRIHSSIARVILRTASRFGNSSQQIVEDLVQETYLKLCHNNYRLLREFEFRHPGAFMGFVQIVAVNVVRDYFKAMQAKRRGANQVKGMAEDFVLPSGEFSPGSPRTIERTILIHEIERQLNVVVAGPDQERNVRVFWLYYKVGLSAGAIAALPDVDLSAKGVESLIFRITRDLRRRMVAATSPGPEMEQASSEGILRAESL
jgi:RNA polymerase sigma-70 factor, ECF subfamily